MNNELCKQLTASLIEAGFPGHYIDRLANLHRALDLNINWFDLLQAMLEQPQLFGQRPETMDSNITRSAALLGLQKSVFTAAALKQPQLFCQRPETIDSNITRSAALLGLEKSVFTTAALRQPQLFCLRPETIDSNVSRSAALLGLEKSVFTAATLRQPQLLYRRPETLALNFTYLRAIVDSRGTSSIAEVDILSKYYNAVTYSGRYLHLRYIIAKVIDTKSSISTILTMPAARAELQVAKHYRNSLRTLQVLYAAGLIKVLPDGHQLAPRSRVRTLSI